MTLGAPHRAFIGETAAIGADDDPVLHPVHPADDARIVEGRARIDGDDMAIARFARH